MCGPPDAPLASLAWKWLAAPGPGCGSQPMVCRRWPGGARPWPANCRPRSRRRGRCCRGRQRGRGERRACPRGCGRRGCERPNAGHRRRAGAGRPPVRGPGHRSGAPWGRYARGGPTDGYVGAAAAVGGAVDELCASERGRRPLAAAGHAVGARLSRGARFDAPTRRHRLGGPGRGPRPLPVDRRRGDDRSRGGPAA